MNRREVRLLLAARVAMLSHYRDDTRGCCL